MSKTHPDAWKLLRPPPNRLTNFPYVRGDAANAELQRLWLPGTQTVATIEIGLKKQRRAKRLWMSHLVVGNQSVILEDLLRSKSDRVSYVGNAAWAAAQQRVARGVLAV